MWLYNIVSTPTPRVSHRTGHPQRQPPLSINNFSKTFREYEQFSSNQRKRPFCFETRDERISRAKERKKGRETLSRDSKEKKKKEEEEEEEKLCYRDRSLICSWKQETIGKLDDDNGNEDDMEVEETSIHRARGKRKRERREEKGVERKREREREANKRMTRERERERERRVELVF